MESVGTPKRTAHRVRDALEQEILSGRFAPGDRLDEARMAERFSVSRTPVREALQGLCATGLVELRPRRGAFVREVGARDLLELFETMGEYEASCARLSALRLTRAHAQALQAALARCEEAVGKVADVSDDDAIYDAYYYENQQFHAAIYAAAGNRFLEDQTVALRNRLKPFRRLQLRARGRARQSQDEHLAIAAALVDGATDRAAELARAHVVVQGEPFKLLLTALEASAETARRAS